MNTKFLKNKKYLAIAAGLAVVLIVSVVLVLVVVLVVLNDGENNDQSVSQEVREYAAACGSMQDFFLDLFSRPGLSYGEILVELEPAVQSYVSTVPPDSLAGMHSFLAEQHTTILDLLQQEDPDSVVAIEDNWVNEFAAYTITWQPQAKQVYDALPENIKQELHNAGCVE